MKFVYISELRAFKFRISEIFCSQTEMAGFSKTNSRTTGEDAFDQTR